MSSEQLIKQATDSGVIIYVCQMSTDLMGFSQDELIDHPDMELADEPKFLGEAGTGRSTLFI